MARHWLSGSMRLGLSHFRLAFLAIANSWMWKKRHGVGPFADETCISGVDLYTKTRARLSRFLTAADLPYRPRPRKKPRCINTSLETSTVKCCMAAKEHIEVDNAHGYTIITVDSSASSKNLAGWATSSGILVPSVV